MATTRDIDVRVKLTGADKFKKDMTGVNDSLGTMGGWLDVTKGILGSQIITKGLEKIREALGDSVEASIEYESALAGLQKTAGLSDTALNNMSNQIMDMSERIPKTSAEIAELADEFAHLGLDQDEILPFTEVMIKLGDTTDMSASEAGTALAQLANVMGTTTDEYENLASTVLYLGMTSATTESNIVDMAQSMSGAGKMFGMDEADVLGLSAALSSIGVESAAGATSIQKLGTQIELMVATGNEDKLAQFAEVAGVTAEQFADLWKTDPAGAIVSFVNGLGDINENGESAIKTLDDLGITEVRVQKNIAGLAAAGDLTERSVDNASKAWEENSALAEATATIYETSASRISMADNAINNAQIAIGDGLSGIKVSAKEAEADIAKSVRSMISSDSLKTDLDSIEASYADTYTNIANTQSKVNVLIDTIEGMGDVSLMSAEDQGKYNANIQALIDIIPGVADVYDAETGAIEGGTAALREMANAQIDLAEAQTDTAKSVEELEAYKIAEENFAELQKQTADAYAEWQIAKKASDDYYNSAKDDELGYIIDPAKIAESERLAQVAADAGSAYQELADAEAEASEYLEQYAYIVDEAVDNTNNLTAANEAVAGMNDDTSASLDELTSKIEGYSTYLDTAMEAYEEYKEAVSENLGKITVGVGEIDYDPGSMDMSDIEANMQQRLTFLTEYQENFKKAEEMGYSDDFLQQFTDGTTSSAEALAGLVTASSEQVTAMNTSYDTMKTKQEELATTLATSATGIDETATQISTAVQGLVDGTNVDLSASGAATVQSLIDGLNSKLAQLKSVTAKIKLAARVNSTAGSTGTTHAQGLADVPYDDYPALLHRGEMVLTSAEAAAYRAEQFMSAGTSAILSARSAPAGGNQYSTSNTQNVSFGTIVIREDADIQKIANEIAKLNKRNAYGRGVRS